MVNEKDYNYIDILGQRPWPDIIASQPKLRYCALSVLHNKNVTDSKSDTFPKSVGYLKSDCVIFEFFVLVRLYNYFCK